MGAAGAVEGCCSSCSGSGCSFGAPGALLSACMSVAGGEVVDLNYVPRSRCVSAALGGGAAFFVGGLVRLWRNYFLREAVAKTDEIFSVGRP